MALSVAQQAAQNNCYREPDFRYPIICNTQTFLPVNRLIEILLSGSILYFIAY